ncbi:MAG TPA: hypothetical protein VGE74_13895 [Gemmata sp.]
MRHVLAVFVFCALPAVSFAQTVVVPASPDLTGKWSGYWVSDTNGHTGPLHARFTPKGAGAYRVTYHGRFAKVIPFRYSTTMDVIGHGDGVVVLSAEKPLGPFGTFRTTATATGTSFDATFNSRRDSGRFVLRR